MNPRGVVTALAISCTCACPLALSFAQTSATQPAKTAAAESPRHAEDYSKEALVFEQLDTIYRMQADGTGERDMHVVMRIQSDGAAQRFGVLTIAFASAYETPHIKYVRVHKADGTTVETPPADAIEMPADVTREAPLYSDLKQLHLPVRSLARGDTLDYEVDTTIDKAEAAGQFWGVYRFDPPGTIIALSETLTLDVPATKYVQVWSPHHPPHTKDENGRRIYTWKSAQLVPAERPTASNPKPKKLKDPDEDSDGRKVPSVAWTTFHSWSEVGDWYRSLAQAEAQPSDAIRAKADEITANAKTPEEQVRALYEYVSTHTRYVGIDFGIGRYKPHAAAEVLANQYGDCKDKDTLLEALLRAKGFSTASALIGAGIAPIPDVPSPAVFNHVITTVDLPSGRIWLDSTPLAAPYRYLIAALRDTKALVIPSAGEATLVSTPANAPYPFSERFEASGVLDDKGKMTANMTITYHDDDELLVRAFARNIAPAEWDKASQLVSASSGFGGTTSNTQFVNGDDPSKPIVLKYSYLRSPFGDWSDLRIVPLFPLTPFGLLDKDKKEPDDDIDLGAPRTLVAITHIQLPKDFSTDLPDAIHVKTDFATFDKTYSFKGEEIVAERTISILKDKLPRAEWKRYEKFTKDISLDGEAWIQLIRGSSHVVTGVWPPPEKPASDAGSSDDSGADTTKEVHVVKIPAEPMAEKPAASSSSATPSAASSASIPELMKSASEKMRSRDWAGATKDLDTVKAKNPNQPGLWAMYGGIAEYYQRDLATAITDYKKELANQPNNETVVGLLASTQNRSGDYSGACATMEKFLSAHPENTRIAYFLSGIQTNAGDNEGALKTLTAAAEHNPDDRNLRIQEGESLIRLGRKDEAAAAARFALDGADDADTLNNAAYVLSEAGLNLDVAEKASREGIDKLEEQSAAETTAQANSAAFGRANLLVASWDTLGWILYKEGKIQEALAWLEPAWHSALLPDIADHLAEIEENLHHYDEAERYYTLAKGAATSNNMTPDMRGDINAGISRMKAAGAKPGPSDVAIALQNIRTFKIARPEGVKGWGSFRMMITRSGVIESQQMSGDQSLAKIKPVVDALKFPELLPPASKAHLLRSAVISCSEGKTCELVLVPGAGLQMERQ